MQGSRGEKGPWGEAGPHGIGVSLTVLAIVTVYRSGMILVIFHAGKKGIPWTSRRVWSTGCAGKYIHHMTASTEETCACISTLISKKNFAIYFAKGRPGRAGFDGLPGYPGFQVSTLCL